MSNKRDTSTLSRWSRLKHESNAPDAEAAVIDDERPPKIGLQDAIDNPVNAPATIDSEQAVETEQLELDENEEVPLLSDEDMPELNTLTSQSDISMFFNKGVSTALRKAALKYVFQLPQYNIRDGLNDYDEDYTYFEPLGDTVTCDMKFHKERKEREAQEAEEQEALLQQEQQEQLEAGNESQQHDSSENTEEPSMDEGEDSQNEIDANKNEAETPPTDFNDEDSVHAEATPPDEPHPLEKNRADV